MRRSGFTLLEVVLALALSVGLLALVGLAISLHSARMADSHAAIEQAQLVRGVLRIITRDLQNVALGYQQDLTAIEAAAAASTTFNVDEADTTTDELAEEEAEETTPSRTAMGLYGDGLSLQLDVNSTQPEWVASLDSTLPQQRFRGGVMQVRYLMQAGENGSPTLVRQQVPRDIALWQAQQGLVDAWETSTRYLAPEVIGLAIRYWDGEQYIDTWNMTEQEGALPVAVEVDLTIVDATRKTTSESAAADQPTRVYRMSVTLPAAPVSSAAASSASSSSSSTSGSSGGTSL
jgi:type II secretory pathway pseudopilin PulG